MVKFDNSLNRISRKSSDSDICVQSMARRHVKELSFVSAMTAKGVASRAKSDEKKKIEKT